jgi:hypothetical protein
MSDIYVAMRTFMTMNVNSLALLDASVWGTVSDWVMIAVTTGTLYFILRTFRSQLKVQQLQQQYTNIENEKFRLEVVPSFDLKISQKTFEREPGEIITLLLIDLELLYHECRDLKIGISSFIYKPVLKAVFPDAGAHLAAGTHRILTVECRADERTFDAVGLNLTVGLIYKDVIGNGYVMNIMINLNFADLEIIPIGPFRSLESQ